MPQKANTVADATNLGGGKRMNSDAESLVRRCSTPCMMFNEYKTSPIHDLAPLAQPGIQNRVMRNGLVPARRESLKKSFQIEDPSALSDDQDLIEVSGGFTSNLAWAAFVAVCPAMQYGWNNGNMNTAAPAMRKDLLIGDATGDNTWALCISVFCLGALLGCSLGSRIADSHGRRTAIMVNSFIYVIGAALEAYCVCFGAFGVSGLTVMMIGRAVSGIAAGATTVVVPVYLGEISPAHLRGALGTLFQLSVVIAMLLAQVLGLPSIMGNEALWPAYMMLAAAPAVILVCGQGKLLESPCWLAGRDPAKAKEVLKALRDEDESVNFELDAMTGAANKGKQSDKDKSGGGGLFSDPRVRPGLTICAIVSLAQQFSGINNAFNYSTTFLSANGIDPATVMIIAVSMNVGNVIISVLSAILMDLLGRKLLLLISSAVMACSIGGLTLALAQLVPPALVSPLAVVSVVCFVAGFGIGVGPIPWLLPAEFLPVESCAKGASFAATCNWSANFIVGLTFPYLSMTLQGYCFVPNAVVLVLLLIFVMLKVPESRGKTVEDILTELGVCKNDEYQQLAK